MQEGEKERANKVGGFYTSWSQPVFDRLLRGLVKDKTERASAAGWPEIAI
jgi:hypothetical protein